MSEPQKSTRRKLTPVEEAAFWERVSRFAGVKLPTRVRMGKDSLEETRFRVRQAMKDQNERRNRGPGPPRRPQKGR